MVISSYYQPKGRDSYIDRYISKKQSLLNRITSTQKNISCKKIEVFLNDLFYSQNVKPEYREKAEKYIDKALEAIEEKYGALIIDGLNDIPEGYGTGKNFLNFMVKTYKDENNETQSANVVKRSVNTIIKIKKQLERTIQNAIKLLQKNGGDKAFEALIEQDGNSYLEQLNTAIKEATEAYIAKGGSSETNFVIFDARRDGDAYQRFLELNENIQAFLNVVNPQAIDNRGAGEFFERVLEAVFSDMEEGVDTLGNQLAKTIVDAKWSGQERIRQLPDLYTNMYYRVEMNEKFFDDEKKPDKKNTHITKTIKTPFGDIEATYNESGRFNYNALVQKKADITLTTSKGKTIGVSAKNWSEAFYDKGIPSVNNKFEASIIQSIGQNFGGENAIKSFLYMMQDNPAAGQGDPPGKYSGIYAFKSAREMGIVATSVSALMGLSQGEGGRADILVINDRSAKRIYVIPIATLLKNYITSTNSNALGYSLHLREETYNFEAWNAAARYINNRVKIGAEYEGYVASIVNNKMVSYWLSVGKNS